MADKIVETICPMDCPDTCSLEVAVEQNKIKRLSGSNKNPNTQGFICTKVSRFARRLEHPSRLKTPLKRYGDSFSAIEWNEAYDSITDRFREISHEFGAEAILPYHYGGSNGFLSDGLVDDYFFARLGASRLLKTLCAVPTTLVATEMYGKMPGVAFEDYPQAEMIIIWGANPKVSNTHLAPYLQKAKANGAFIAVIDPVNNFSENEIDLHLAVKPGTDLPLALALINFWHQHGLIDRDFLAKHAVNIDILLDAAREWDPDRAAELCGLETADIEILVKKYAEASPALIRCGWGLERNRNGGQAVAAVLAIPALMDKFGIRGGGYTMSNSGAVTFNAEKAFGALNWHTRQVNMTRLADILNGNISDPPVKAIFIYNCNPAVTVPDQVRVIEGLKRRDLFVIVFDQVMTDTAQLADLVLPATTFLEHRDLIRSYGSYVMGQIKPVVAPPAQAKPNYEVFAALGCRMGFKDKIFRYKPEELIAIVSENIERPYGGEKQLNRLQTMAPPVQFRTVFPQTPNGMINLAPDILGSNPFSYISNSNSVFPLALISPATARTTNSTMGEFNFPQLFLRINPGDAADRGIVNGNTVRVYNNQAEVICPARISDKVRTGVVMLPKGAWRAAAQNGFTATALAPAHVNTVGGAACYNDALVEVKAIN